MIKDSGERREFESGAVRDIQEGKGRCDLLPLDVIAAMYQHHTDKIGAPSVLRNIYNFTVTGDTRYLEDAIEWFLLNDAPFGDANWATVWLEISKHFEEGCQKYGENNWKKGIPSHCYIDSGVRHYLKWLRGDKDEPHDRAFIWNMICCIWTCRNIPNLNEYRLNREKYSTIEGAILQSYADAKQETENKCILTKGQKSGIISNEGDIAE